MEKHENDLIDTHPTKFQTRMGRMAQEQLTRSAMRKRLTTTAISGMLGRIRNIPLGPNTVVKQIPKPTTKMPKIDKTKTASVF